MRRRLAAFLALLLAVSASAASLDERLKEQKSIFAEFWGSNLKLNPLLATAVGDDRYNDKLGDYSLAGIRRPSPACTRSPRR